MGHQLGQQNGQKAEKLTLDQAAEKLGIKRGSVYKRVQRGTLEHTKGPDGQVYVYLDADDEKSVISGAQREREKLPLTFGELSAIIGVVAALTYALGVFTLWAPIARVYTHDFDTAWYAVSLFPRTVAVGRAVKELPLLFFTLGIMVAVLFTWQYTFYLFKDRGRRFYLAAVGMLYFAFSIPYLIWYFRSIPHLGLGARLEGEYMVGAALTSCLVLVSCLNNEWTATRILNVEYQGASPLPKIRRRRSLAMVLVIWLCLIFAWDFLSVAFWREPALPKAELFTNSALPNVAMSAQSSVHGTFLTHVDGYWYVFHKGNLISIPDDKVKLVQIAEQ